MRQRARAAVVALGVAALGSALCFFFLTRQDSEPAVLETPILIEEAFNADEFFISLSQIEAVIASQRRRPDSQPNPKAISALDAVSTVRIAARAFLAVPTAETKSNLAAASARMKTSIEDLLSETTVPTN